MPLKKRIISIMKSSSFILRIISLVYSLRSILRITGRQRNKITLKGVFLKNTKIRINGQRNSLLIHPENRLSNCKISIYGSSCTVIIEKHCILTNVELWIEDNHGEIKIGSLTTIEGGHIAVTEGGSVTIGKDCMFSHEIVIRNGDSHTIYSQLTNQRINCASDVFIGDHVWFGEGVKVLKGSKIENGSIIATGAIVSGTVENNSIYAGIPAKKIKDNIHWIRERK
jgi:acetyltransferase-like isoleucine patch superfamily enzyme